MTRDEGPRAKPARLLREAIKKAEELAEPDFAEIAHDVFFRGQV